MAGLRVRGLHHYVTGDKENNSLDMPDDREHERLTSTTAFITMLVDPKIIARLSESQGKTSSPAVLMQRLESMCAHFRFLDLPPELRNRVYKYTMGDPIIDITKKRTENYPGITQVSRQTMNETLSLFYSTCTVKLAFKYINQPVAKIAQQWILNIAQEHANHLQEVVVVQPIQERFSRRSAKVEIRFTLDPKDGLRIVLSDRLANASKASLRRYVTAANAACEMMGCKNDGRAFFFAFATNPDIWRELWINR